MDIKPDYRLGVVFLGVGIIAANFLYIGTLPIRMRGPLLVAEGLLLDGLGAVIALLPDVVGGQFEPTEKIDRIEKAQDELFLEGELNKSDGFEGYEELAGILAEESDLEAPPDRIQAQTGGFGASARLYFWYEKEDWSPEEYEGDEEYPRAKYNIPGSLGPTGVMDSRVSQYIEKLKDKTHRKGFFSGLVLLTTGFALQLWSTLLSNSSVFADWLNLVLGIL